jgi:hypothetical protein
MFLVVSSEQRSQHGYRLSSDQEMKKLDLMQASRAHGGSGGTVTGIGTGAGAGAGKDDRKLGKSTFDKTNPKVPKLPFPSSNSSEEAIQTFLVFDDFFESFQTKVDFYSELSLNHPHTKFVLFNLPGQAYTHHKKGTTLNNNYYSSCLDFLFYYLEELNLINLSANPFAIIAYGNGGNIAMHWGNLFASF